MAEQKDRWWYRLLEERFYRVRVKAQAADECRRLQRAHATGWPEDHRVHRGQGPWRARPDVGPYFYEPTILTGVREGMAAFHDETFGPVVSLYPVDSEDEAIAKANDSAYGLNFSVWTSDPKRGRRVASRLQAGTVNVNEAYAAAWGRSTRRWAG